MSFAVSSFLKASKVCLTFKTKHKCSYHLSGFSTVSVNILNVSYRFPRVFGDEFGDEFGDSLNFVSKLVTHLVMISVNHCIW